MCIGARVRSVAAAFSSSRVVLRVPGTGVRALAFDPGERDLSRAGA
jgi:hypothetical protein